MWEANKQQNIEQVLKHVKGGGDNKMHAMWTKAKKTKQKPKLGFLGSGRCMHK